MTDNARGALLMTVAMAGFVINDTFMKAAASILPLFQLITLRGLLTLAALAVIAGAAGGFRFRMRRRDAGFVALRSLGEVGGTLTFLLALKHMPLANLSAILQSLPLFVTLAAALFLGEPVGWRRMAAIGAGFAGVLLVVRPGTEGFDVWSVVGLVSVLFVVVRDLATRRLSPEVPSSMVALASGAAVTGTAAVFSIVEGWAPVTSSAAGLIVGAAAFLVVGYLTVIMATRTGDIGFVAPFRYTTLLFAILSGALVFGALPDAFTLAGAAVIVASGIYTFHRERRLARAVTPERAFTETAP